MAEDTGSIAGRVLLVTGMSGAGRTTALKGLEDIGFEAVDNLPLRLMSTLIRQGPEPGRGLAVGVDMRTRDFTADAFTAEVAELRAETGHAIQVLFLDCDDEVLRRRYTETRRMHPLGADRPLTDGIARERRLLSPLRAVADVVLDSSHTNVHEITQHIRDHFAAPAAAQSSVFVTSFSYRRGLPRDADLVFDVRFLANPHYEPELRPLAGTDPAVGRYIETDVDYGAFIAALEQLMALLLPRVDREGKSYLTIAIGCTGGRHRSVHVAERLAAWLTGLGRRVRVEHRDLAADVKQGAGAEEPA